MCKCLSLSHITKIHIILIKQTIFSIKLKKKGDQVSDLLCPKLSELLYFLYPAYPISIKITVIMMPMQSQMRS